VTLTTLEGTFGDNAKVAQSDVFEITADKVTVTYDISTTSAGGNGWLYILPEDETLTQDADGNHRVPSVDVESFGGQGKEIAKEEPGRYYIYFNTSGVGGYSISVEEKR